MKFVIYLDDFEKMFLKIFKLNFFLELQFERVSLAGAAAF